MIPFLVCFGAFVVIFLFAQNGTKVGGFVALCGLLGALMALLAGFRYWFLLSHLLAERENLSLPLLAVTTFWSVFIIVIFIFAKLRHQLAMAYESVTPSFVDRVLGCLFGSAAGLAVVAVMMMTLSMLSPKFWPEYQPSQLPLPVDRWPVQAYRFIETNCARISPTEKGHTLLPVVNNKYTENPEEFWK